MDTVLMHSPYSILQERRSRTKLLGFLVVLEVELVLPCVHVPNGNIRAGRQVLFTVFSTSDKG